MLRSVITNFIRKSNEFSFKQTFKIKSFDEMNADMEAIQQKMLGTRRNKRANALNEVRSLGEEFGLAIGMLKRFFS